MSMVYQTDFSRDFAKGPVGQVSRPNLPYYIQKFTTTGEVHVGGPVKLNEAGKIEIAATCGDAKFTGIVFRDPRKLEGAPSKNLVLPANTQVEVMVYGHIFVNVKGISLFGDLCLTYTPADFSWATGDALPEDVKTWRNKVVFDETVKGIADVEKIISVQIK